MLKDVESIIQCTKTIQALTLDANVDDLYANSEFDSGTSVSAFGCTPMSHAALYALTQASPPCAKTL